MLKRFSVGRVLPAGDFAVMSTASSAASVFFSAASSEDGEPKRVIQLLPMGEIVARDGRKWLLQDRAHAEAVVAASMEWTGQTDLPFDYDHQIPFGAREGVGGTAKASGWMKGLEVRDDGIWASVEWTAAAEAALRAKEYRYVSPYFFHQPDGRITRIANAALTNTPAIRELPAVASSSGGDLNQEPSMKFTDQLVQALGLTGTPTEAEILAAVQTNATAASSAVTAATAAAAAALLPVATALGLTEAAKPEEVAAAATAAAAGQADPAKFVPIAAFTSLQAQVKTLTDGQTEAAAAAAVDAAMEAGKLAPAMKDWGLGYARKDLTGFQAFVGQAPVVVPATAAAQHQQTKNPAGGEPQLTPELAAAAAAVGCTTEEILATAKAEV